ncbi:MAG: hypothetical protein CMP36_01545 [Rickettsiales bacterium]|nr:hypothetical protein [Rickettsiales bacterium]OUV81850.1 MAG: hypothetical protein CBC91_02045 [Rickettsiales bacterium TMED131]
MFKHKIIKYLSISIIAIFFALGFLLLRLAFKPLDISYVNNILPKIDKYITQLEGVKFEEVLLNLDLMKNEINLELNKVYFKKNLLNISNLKAMRINLSFKASDLIKNKTTIKKIYINKGGIDIHNFELSDSYNVNKRNDIFNKLLGADIQLEEININFYKENNKIAVISNFDGVLKNTEQGINFGRLNADQIIYVNDKKNINLTFNNIKLKEEFKKDFTMSIESIMFKDKNSVFKSKYFKQIKNFKVENIKFKFNQNEEVITAEGSVIHNNKKSLFDINGSLLNYTKFNGVINVSVEKNPILAKLNLDYLKQYNYNLENSSSMLFDGKINLNIKNNLVDKIIVNASSLREKNKATLVNLRNNSKLSIEDIYINLEYYEDQVKLKNLEINEGTQKINMYGHFYIKHNKFDTTFKFKSFDYDKAYNLVKSIFIKGNDKLNFITKYKANNIENLELNLEKNDGNILVKSFHCEINDINITTNKNLTLKTASLKVLKNNENIELFSKELETINEFGEALLSNTNIVIRNLKNFKSDFQMNTYLKTDYRFFKNTLSSLNYNRELIDDMEGNIAGKLFVNKNIQDINFSYLFEGQLMSFNYKPSGKNNFPLQLENFFGNIVFSDSELDIKGSGKINKSNSIIRVSIDENSLLKIKIQAEAKPESFDIFGEYNFITKGNTKLKLDITKDLNNELFTVAFNANLFSSEVNLKNIIYKKLQNKRGEASGIFYFRNNELISVKKLNFFTEDILINSDLFFTKNLRLKNVNINRFIKDRNDFRAQISFIGQDSCFISIDGKRIDLKHFFETSSDKFKNIDIKLNIDNLHYNKINLGKTNIKGVFKDTNLEELEGHISYDNIKYVNFNKSNNQQKYFKTINIHFDDFGAFLNNSNISNSFIGGNSKIELNIKNYSLISGKVSIEKSSIKNSSFLARLLQLASFTGLLEILTNEGIPFDNININFTKEESKIIVQEAKFQGFSLGGKLNGSTDINTKKINLEGVIVPAYAINYLINKIPLIGQVITGVEGEGLIGVNFKAKGTIEDPNYTINPLSILTPGIIRSIFDSLFEENNENRSK